MQLAFPFAPYETYTWYFRNGNTKKYTRYEINFNSDGSWIPLEFIKKG
jgi:hypothetical protein